MPYVPEPNELVAEKQVPADTLSSYLPRVDQFYIPEWLTMQFVANNMVSFTPLLSYGSTVLSIERCKTALGFSIDICATMMIASILRVSYYLITPYEITLLRQSLVMIFIQLILLRTSLKYRPEEYRYDNLKDVEPLSELLQNVWLEQFGTNRPHIFSDDWKQSLMELSARNVVRFVWKISLVFAYKILKFFDPSYKRVFAFWQWNDDRIFWKFLMIFSSIQILVTLFICKLMNWDKLAQYLGSIIGSMGLLVESLLPLPQISILNNLKSVQGFKLILLVSWLCGDTVKITYLAFGAKNISVLFFFFAFFQMFLDFYIAGQYIYYKYYYNKDKNDGTQEEDIELETLDSSAKDKLVLSSNDTKSHYPGVNEAERSLVMENKTDTPPPSVVGGPSRRSSTI
ncbi:hypothetical protein RI543_004421 [Arxiozyma heterogenica]|uniref:Uncharacterized protein n=1 Tax=Arxiozyma heterogenica TaxID=278026 RepID=A0AAN8A7L6_9SACH|nr:hypothetical protein RI543_004421 [Kazachstania heterogenica]